MALVALLDGLGALTVRRFPSNAFSITGAFFYKDNLALKIKFEACLYITYFVLYKNIECSDTSFMGKLCLYADHNIFDQIKWIRCILAF
jgi:hypothetical protein